jgi:FkbM family methyltransferase
MAGIAPTVEIIGLPEHGNFMKRVVQSVLGRAGFRLIRLEALNNIESLRDEVVRLRDEVDQLRRTNLELQPFFENIFGHAMHVDPADLGHRFSSLNGARPEHGEAGYIVRNVKAGQTALDIGANVGLYTLLLARSVGPSGLVFGFEPGPKSYSLLLRNVTVNGYRHARVENAAVSDHSGTVDLFICRTGESDNRIAGTLLDYDERDRMPVRCVSIDDYVAEKSIKSVNFIKMDVQGAEPFALRGMRATLEKNAEVQLLMEYAPAGMMLSGSNPADVLDFLEGLSFKLFLVPEAKNEIPTTKNWLLENVGLSDKPAQVNLIARRNRVGLGSYSV